MLTIVSSSRRRALLALLLLVPVPSLGVAAAMAFPATADTELGQAMYAFAKVWLLLMPLLWWRLVDRQPFSLSPPRNGGFGVAIGLGVLIGAVIWAGYAWLGSELIDLEHLRETAEKTGLGSASKYILFSLYACTINSILEEFVWRWFVFDKCRTLLPHCKGWLAVVLSAVFFTAHHIIAVKAQFGWEVTVLASTGVFVGGVVWSWCYLKFQSVWPGYVSHLIVDVVIFTIGWKLIAPS